MLVVGLVLVLVLVVELELVLALGLGLAAMRAASEAEATAEAELWDDDGEAEGEPDDPENEAAGEPDDPEGDAAGEPDPEPVGDGDAGSLLGSLLGLVVAAGEVEEPDTEGDGVGVFFGLGVFFGFGFGVFFGFGFGVFVGFGVAVFVGLGVAVFVGLGVGVGVFVGVGLGEDVLEVGSTRQLVSALAPVPALAEPACAVPCRPASRPMVSKPPLSTLSAVTRTCARRVRIALSPLLIYSSGLLSALYGFGGD